MKQKLKYISVLSAAVTAFCQPGMLMQTKAMHVQKIVVLGDSISSGSGLAENQKSYAALVEEYTNAQIQNFSQERYTTANVLTCLSDPQIQQALSEADLILITVGEHDIMDRFIKLSQGFMTQFGFEKFTDVFQANPEDYGIRSEDELLPYADLLSNALRSNQAAVQENIQKIHEELEHYPHAKIIWQTAYNPTDTIDFIDTLSDRRKEKYLEIMNSVKSAMDEALNHSIAQFAEENGHCIVIDTAAGFAGNAWKYTNLYQLDLNPSAEGHAWIANALIQKAALSRNGDVNEDSEINASDAAAVLGHAASIGAGKGGTFSEDQIKGGDVDGDGTANAQDAAQILSYAAAKGSGKTYTFRKYDGVQLVDPDPDMPDTSEPEVVDPDPDMPDTSEPEVVDPDPDMPDTSEPELVDPDPTAPIWQ